MTLFLFQNTYNSSKIDLEKKKTKRKNKNKNEKKKKKSKNRFKKCEEFGTKFTLSSNSH